MPKTVDQPLFTPNGSLTQNGLFARAANQFKEGSHQAELVEVYEKIKDGIWVFNGTFKLVDAWVDNGSGRAVNKFRLELQDSSESQVTENALNIDLPHDRIIPPAVKLEVWKRDKGRCVKCGATKNLHFDHILPFSKGGSSLIATNIQLLCLNHNLEKRDRLDL